MIRTLALIFLLPALIHAQEPPAKPSVSLYIDYASSVQPFMEPILEAPLSTSRAPYKRQLAALADLCKKRVKDKEADWKLADKTYSLCKKLNAAINEWESKQGDLERIKNDSGLLRTSASSRDQQALQDKINRKTSNLERLFEDDLKLQRNSAERLFATVEEWQDILKDAIQNRHVILETDIPTPPSTNTTTQPSRPPKYAFNSTTRPTLTDPDPQPDVDHTKYTFSMDPIKSKIGDNVKTPPKLLPQVKETAAWLEAQNRRAGAKLATRIYASQEGRNIFLYLHMTELFNGQDRDVRQRFAEGIQKFWAMKCRQAGHCYKNSDAHLVLVDHNVQPVGMSADADGTIIRLLK